MTPTRLTLPLLLVLNVFCGSPAESQIDYSLLRRIMVSKQIEGRGIHDQKVLEAMRKVPRHRFVPEPYKNQAYRDHPLPIAAGQTISQPYIVALMTEVLNLDSMDAVLEIGTGSGYQAAVLAEICRKVYTMEIIPTLGKTASALLDSLGYTNLEVRIGDGYKGWKEKAPFDAIIVTCAPTHIPGPLKDQLAEGGKMVIPVGKKYTQELVLVTKEYGVIRQKSIVPVRFVPMLKPGKGEY